MLKTILFSIITAFLLSGCFPNVKPETPTYTVIKTVPADALLANCPVTKPRLDEKEYLKLDYEAKETFLSSLVISLYGDLVVCNKQLEGLRNWKKQITDP